MHLTTPAWSVNLRNGSSNAQGSNATARGKGYYFLFSFINHHQSSLIKTIQEENTPQTTILKFISHFIVFIVYFSK